VGSVVPFERGSLNSSYLGPHRGVRSAPGRYPLDQNRKPKPVFWADQFPGIAGVSVLPTGSARYYFGAHNKPDLRTRTVGAMMALCWFRNSSPPVNATSGSIVMGRARRDVHGQLQVNSENEPSHLFWPDNPETHRFIDVVLRGPRPLRTRHNYCWALCPTRYSHWCYPSSKII